MSSNVQVFVHWNNPTIFSGEDLECKIIFKNIALPPESPPEFAANNQRQQIIAASQTPVGSVKTLAPPNSRLSRPGAHGHRPTVSLDAPISRGKVGGPGSLTGHANGTPAYAQKHRRSVSIISLGGVLSVEREAVHGQSSGHLSAARRPVRNHARSASLQVLPRGPAGTDAGPSSAPLHVRAGIHPSPLINPSRSPSTSESNPSQSLPFRHIRRLSGTVSGPYSPGRPLYQIQPSGSVAPNIRIPRPSPTTTSPLPEAQYLAELEGTQNQVSGLAKAQGPNHLDHRAAATEHLHPVTKVLSGSSMNGTPRSSVEFYSMSNNSTETLASECAPQPFNRFSDRTRHSRQRPQPATVIASRKTLETLMMGYAQVVGSFTLDGSLINQAPFEEVKRKGILGGEGGGGVVGVERSKSNSGLFGALGWGSIGESLGGLLGDRELSSIKEMREMANSRSVPLLSTPKSILFVDLQLAPGESRSYTYSFTLPRGLPPSHKGKAIKISYQLVLGTQRANTPNGQQIVRHVNVPFRVLGSVNGEGEILGHDLMSPHVPLHDQARVRCLKNDSVPSEAERVTSVDTKGPDSSLQGFLSYVDGILEKPRQNSSLGLLSPTASQATPQFSRIEGPASSREAIDLAILRSNVATSSNRSTNRFEIARNGQRVAVIMLTRSAYRLGETVTAAIDLSVADIPCYSIYGTLETSENVDPAIALRSGASIHRVTRRIHASHTENTLFARKAIFSPSIPATATPGFITSGVSLEWSLRIRFVTPRIIAGEENLGGRDALLEEVSRDDRGLVMAAAESLACESFEITVPLRIYGAVAGWSESNEVEGLPI